MNARETMAFKAMLKRIAAEENVPAQVVLQNYMFERLMARLVKLPLRKDLILKGGLLVSHLLGLSRRTTMDMDVTLRNAELSEATVRSWMERILSVDVGDGVGWTLRGIAPIRDDDIYGGYRVKMTASLGAITVPLSMDVSTGDAICPRPENGWKRLLRTRVSSSSGIATSRPIRMWRTSRLQTPVPYSPGC